MWHEIDKINSIVPEEQMKKVKISLTDRLAYKCERKPDAPKNLFSIKNYKGPLI